jgi:hypothetical protein
MKNHQSRPSTALSHIYRYQEGRLFGQSNVTLHSAAADTSTRLYAALETPYLYPVDSTQHTLEKKIYRAINLAIDGICLCQDAVEAVLQPSGPRKKRILDIGYGSADW